MQRTNNGAPFCVSAEGHTEDNQPVNCCLRNIPVHVFRMHILALGETHTQSDCKGMLQSGVEGLT